MARPKHEPTGFHCEECGYALQTLCVINDVLCCDECARKLRRAAAVKEIDSVEEIYDILF